MSETLFISDLHLSADHADTVERFSLFLAERARKADELYILGDLFDAWLGDDGIVPPVPNIIADLRACSDSGTRIFLMHGNRDFLLGDEFAQATGCQIIPDPTLIDLFGTPTLLMHGDLLCTDDVQYQAFRAQIRQPAFIQGFLSKSIQERIAIAAEYRKKSGEATSNKAQDIMDVNDDTVKHIMNEHGVHQLIHGHTHRPAHHKIDLNGTSASRYVLSEWQSEQISLLSASHTGIQTEDI